VFVDREIESRARSQKNEMPRCRSHESPIKVVERARMERNNSTCCGRRANSFEEKEVSTEIGRVVQTDFVLNSLN